MRVIDAPLDGTGLKVGIVAGRFNDFVSNSLVSGAHARLTGLGVADDDIDLAWVAGAFEVPLAARAMAESGRYDAVVCLGAVIRGETPHFDYVAGETASGIMRTGHDTGVPVVFGVLTTDTVEQAMERAEVDRGDKGADCADAAVEMARLLAALGS
ncbi:MAG: 6,7-dimethyl-8-ribityllumazine synthase [Acidimicrobiales bacterium]|nr:6,7-dimethyl-8-ribityllumazine synthase [Acidimicrobiaceae bacterium]MDP7258091.1 6,7-dimethyl-8-ribityllumazine synthase [Acidimicrobiales bacterium]HJO79447.1 6,7-dimethyl-8-ribityllumazine synthase [Acidimicrobiales bacterium]